jgi:hypothetical protein
MLYHTQCEANEAREFGWPLECIQMRSTGEIQYQCRACGELFNFHIEDDLPDRVEEVD